MTRSIRHLVTAVLAIGATALVLSACGGSDDGSDANASSSGSSDLVSVMRVNGTNVLADGRGRTLYSADVEKGGTIRCTGACTSFWRPVVATARQSRAASADLDLSLGTIRRADGDEQLTFKGLPLYSFTQESAGMLDGDGFVDDFDGTHFEWAAATTGAGAASQGSGDAKSIY